MPLWLLEYLLFNKAGVPPASKISFVLLPWPNPDPDGERLPELLNVYVTPWVDYAPCLSLIVSSAQSKLTASRFLRVRKLTHHVRSRIPRIGWSLLCCRCKKN